MKKCPACNKGGKKWRTIVVKGSIIKATCGNCGYSLDKTKGLRTTST